MNLFSTELGAKYRAALVAFSAFVSALILLVQEVLDIAKDLPDWGPTSTVLLILTGIITFLGRFTGLGNVTPPDPPEGDDL